MHDGYNCKNNNCRHCEGLFHVIASPKKEAIRLTWITGDQMPSQMTLWVQILQALLTPVVAGLAVVIAWAQWRVVRRREVMELFERRVAIYEALRKVIGQVIPTGKVTDKDLHDFVVATDRTRFLFGDDVVKYVDGLYKTPGSRGHHGHGSRLRGISEGRHIKNRVI